MGVWDHFYPNSAIDEGVSTHYVDLPHFRRFESKPVILGDDQHDSLDQFDIDKVASDVGFHQYVRNYAGYLMNKGVGDIKNQTSIVTGGPRARSWPSTRGAS